MQEGSSISLPHFVELAKALAPLFSAFATLIIGLVAGYIAWRQWKTNHTKLQFELFDKRLTVYRAASALIGAILRDGYPTDEELVKFMRDVDMAKWIFDEDFFDYLSKVLWVKATELAAAQAGKEGAAPDERARLIKEKAVLWKWFADQREALPLHAKRFLQIDY